MCINWTFRSVCAFIVSRKKNYLNSNLFFQTEIPDFLTPDECEYIVSRALHEGLYPSGVNDEAYYSSLANTDGEDEDDVDTTEEDSQTDEEATSVVFAELDVNDDMVK